MFKNVVAQFIELAPSVIASADFSQPKQSRPGAIEIAALRSQ